MTLSERMAVMSVVCVLGKFITAGLSLHLGTFAIEVGTVDAASLACILTPVLGALHLGNYVGKKGKTSDDKA